uniref:Coatomer subunit beta n=1 Tax=Saccoglossus kowalevskii TaxID=10224 RepID=A0ABM0LYS3_SACKO|nr:PREDICTED: LOW QUALITY PROTEIN: coatomer subunit beta-like [Saccoglossus kowalevskii]
MTASENACYTLINVPTDSEPPTEMQLKIDLEKGDVRTKTDCLKKVIHMILNGEKMPSLLMTIIRFVLPLHDHTIKKLLLIFWEIVPKTHPDGKLLQEMILVCDAYRKDLQHPNEFIRGSTLRFLCKLKEPELLEPLMPAIRACLEHRHSYVRRNAVMAIFTIYKNFDFLIPDAPELIHTFLEQEQDASCKRNAFMMLIHADQERALDYLSTCIDQVHTFNDILQLVIVELIYKVCHANPAERARFIRCIYNLLNSSSPSVRYEAAGTLVTLSSAPTAVKAAASSYIELILKESDNNVKLIVLDRLISLKEAPAHERVLQELVMDILRVLSAPDLEVRKKTLQLALDLVSSRNIEEMVLYLKKEVTKTHNTGEHEDTGKYRQLLVRTLHSCSVKFPDVAGTIIPVLMEFLSDKNELAAADVLVFVREAMQRYDQLRPVILGKLLEVFPSIKAVKIHRAALWILGEYCTTSDDIQSVMYEIRTALGDIPLVDSELKKAAGESEDDERAVTYGQRLVTEMGTYATQSALSSVSTRQMEEDNRPPLRGYLLKGDFFVGASLAMTLTKIALRYIKISEDQKKQNMCTFSDERAVTYGQRLVTEMGTYATQSALSSVSTRQMEEDNRPPLRGYLLEGDFFVGASLAMTLTKIALRYIKISEDQKKQNSFVAEAMFIMATILHLGKSGLPKKSINDDDLDCIALCLRVLSERSPLMIEIFNQGCRASLSAMLHAKNLEEKETKKDQLALSLSLAMGQTQKKEAPDISTSKLNKVSQLTGFSDPVYAEAYVHVNQYDIVLDVLIVNQTSDTLQNCTLELATLGDLKLVEKPQPVTMAPHDFCNIKANVKVASTENGIIFGNIVYDVSGAANDRNVVVLNDIHIDIMDYIVPASCTDAEFRQMWAEFEWENKVTVNTNIADLSTYLRHLIKSTNMKCLTPEKGLSGECGFMAANLYAKSIFGEDALANLSIEKPYNSSPETPVTGHIRIRAKSQGMALSLGDKINMSQKVDKSRLMQERK